MDGITASAPAILLVGNFLSGSGGHKAVCEELAEQLQASAWPVIRTSAQRSKAARLIDMLFTCWSRRHEYDRAQVDVFSGSAFVWAELSCWLLRRLGRPYVLTLHGGSLPQFAERWPGRVRRLLHSAAAVTTPSRYLYEKMSGYRDGLLIVPNAIDLTRYHSRLRERPAPHLMWLRSFHAIYNPSLAIEVLALTSEHYPEARLTMVGPDKGDGSLQAAQSLARRLGVENRVEFNGGIPKERVPEWLQKGDIFLNTTDTDNTPVSVLEAMACGLCVVSTNVGGIPFLLHDGEDALLVERRDAATAAQAVRRIIDNPSLAAKLSGNGRRLAEQFDWSVVIPCWFKLLQSVGQG